MPKLPYREGTWFAVPLAEEGHAVGRVARHSPKGRVVLAYFFGPKRDNVPSLDYLSSLKPKEAIAVMRIGDLGLIDGTWPLIGESDDWNREKWPVPAFTRTDDLIENAAWEVRYSDDDPAVVLSEKLIPFDPSLPDSDGLVGAMAAVSALSNMLEG